MVRVVAHINPGLAHQVEHGEVLREGLARHGIDLEVTADKTRAGDIHIVSGPWYALDEWRGKPNVLWLDRCFYGDAHDNVSIGWLKPDGSREFGHKQKQQPKGKAPTIAPLKPYRGSCVVFGDYGRESRWDVEAARKIHPRVYYRPHPNDKTPVKALTLGGDLAGVWALCDTAIGHSSTVLVEAVLNGLHTTSTDPRHVIGGVEHDRERWAAQLTWCQWSLTEIKSGAFWEHLSEHHC